MAATKSSFAKEIGVFINHSMDSGNIRVIACNDARDIRVAINPDRNTEKFQWFHFSLHNSANLEVCINIENAEDAAYVLGWEDYQAVASYDRETWFRVNTTFNGKSLQIDHEVEEDLIYFAYFAPYSTERHRDLIASCQADDRVQYESLGETLDGQTVDMLRIGQPAPHKKVCWLIARQHPGETMAEWWMEGALATLLDDSSAVARSLLAQCVFYLVPNMNPDGSRRGHLRHNAVGTDLNRAWRTASTQTSPEVYWVLEKMEQTGVDFFLDVHGDEGLPYNFIAGAEGIPSWSENKQNQLDAYKYALRSATPEFQTAFGYDIDKPGEANLDIGSNFIAMHFDCLAMTLEMPFKDNAELPNPTYGWSPERASALAAPCLQALQQCLPRL